MSKYFLNTLFTLLTNERAGGIVHWSLDGLSFVVRDPVAMETTVMPRYFSFLKYSTFKTYAREYGFTEHGNTFFAPYFHRRVKYKHLPTSSKDISIPRKPRSGKLRLAVDTPTRPKPLEVGVPFLDCSFTQLVSMWDDMKFSPLSPTLCKMDA